MNVQQLAAIESIKQLKARYLRCVDTKAWDEMRELYLPKAQFDFRCEAPDAYLEDVNAFIELLRSVLNGTISIHHGHTSEIAFRSADEATGIWAMEDRIWWPDGAYLHGYGHYHDLYRRGEDGRWRIAATRLTRLRRVHETAEEAVAT